MTFSEEERAYIFDKTDGYCYYCGKKLSWSHWGAYGERGAWHIDHKNPGSRGGSDYLRNLVAACIDCNLEKGNRSAQDYRREWEPATLGGKIVEAFDLPPGTLGASRRRVKRE